MAYPPGSSVAPGTFGAMNVLEPVDHPLRKNDRGLVHRCHPEKGWQFWCVIRGCWVRDYECGTSLGRDGDHAIAYELTVEDAEESQEQMDTEGVLSRVV